MSEPTDPSGDELRDALPDDLNVSAFVGPYQFPEIGRASCRERV